MLVKHIKISSEHTKDVKRDKDVQNTPILIKSLTRKNSLILCQKVPYFQRKIFYMTWFLKPSGRFHFLQLRHYQRQNKVRLLLQDTLPDVDTHIASFVPNPFTRRKYKTSIVTAFMPFEKIEIRRAFSSTNIILLFPQFQNFAVIFYSSPLLLSSCQSKSDTSSPQRPHPACHHQGGWLYMIHFGKILPAPRSA